jgi:serine/threonine protein kinase
VMKVKRKDTGEIFALKVMDKKHIIRENKVNLVKMERMILDQLDFPGIIRLCFTFQDSYSLCILAGRKFISQLLKIFHLCNAKALWNVNSGGCKKKN